MKTVGKIEIAGGTTFIIPVSFRARSPRNRASRQRDPSLGTAAIPRWARN